MPNAVAFAALLGWPVVSIWLFRTLPVERAIIWSVVASFLLLPSSFAIDLPGFPALDKVTVPNLALLALVLLLPDRQMRFLPESRIGKVLIFLLILGPFLTANANPDALGLGETVIPGMTPYDGLSTAARDLLAIVPFLLGRQFLAHPDSHREILKVLCASGIAYSFLMLFEVRMSPQLHSWIYGFFQHSFVQHMRGGGFRPVVFLPHGLWAAFFAMTAAAAAAILWRSSRGHRSHSGSRREDPSGKYLLASGWLSVVLVLCKSLGSLVHAAVALPILVLASPRTQLRIAAVLVLIVIAYPALRWAGLFPIDSVLEIAQSIDENRAASLGTRIENEEALLEKAAERPILGWGSWGRNRIYDPVSGHDLSLTDGFWVIMIGSWGWIGYIATFGLLALPVLAVLRRTRSGPEPDLVTSGLCILLAVNLVELVPNSTLPPWTWLIAGALLGYAERPEQESAREPRVGAPTPQRKRTVL